MSTYTTRTAVREYRYQCACQWNIDKSIVANAATFARQASKIWNETEMLKTNNIKYSAKQKFIIFLLL